MSLKVETRVLQEMLSKAVKGVGGNKMIPITSLIAIKLEEKTKKLTLITTDGNNYLHVIEPNVEGEDFYIVVEADTLSKLVARMTSEFTTMTVDENALIVKGNGTYKIDIPLDENGEPIKFPEGNVISAKKGKTYEVEQKTIQTILSSLKPSLATTLEEPCYTGYYVGDIVVSTDSLKLAAFEKELFEKPVLISSEMMDLLSVITDEKFKVRISENDVNCLSSNCEIYGTVLDGIEDYSIKAIRGLIDRDMECMVPVSKNEMLQALDRIALFVGAYDNGCINLSFADNTLTISSKATNGVEEVTIRDGVINFQEFECGVDIFLLQQQIKAINSDTFELWYGTARAIKLVDLSEDVVQVLALVSK